MTEKTQVDVSVWPKVEERIVELSEKLEKLMGDHAPEAWEAAQRVVQMEGISDVVLGVVLAIACWPLARFSARMFRAGTEITKERGDRYRNDEEVKYMVAGGVSASVTGIIGLVAMIQLLSFWSYVAIFAPDLVIARRLLDGVI